MFIIHSEAQTIIEATQETQNKVNALLKEKQNQQFVSCTVTTTPGVSNHCTATIMMDIYEDDTYDSAFTGSLDAPIITEFDPAQAKRNAEEYARINPNRTEAINNAARQAAKKWTK